VEWRKYREAHNDRAAGKNLKIGHTGTAKGWRLVEEKGEQLSLVAFFVYLQLRGKLVLCFVVLKRCIFCCDES